MPIERHGRCTQTATQYMAPWEWVFLWLTGRHPSEWHCLQRRQHPLLPKEEIAQRRK